MSTIMVKMPGLEGEVTTADYEGQLGCRTLRHTIALPVFARGAQRTEGASWHGAIELGRAMDKASPLLRHAVCSHKDFDEVVITRLETRAGTRRVAEEITLKQVNVVRIDLDTPVDMGTHTPVDEPIETISLEYGEIKWDYKYLPPGGTESAVIGAYDIDAQAIPA